MYKIKILLLFVMLVCILDKVNAFIKDTPLLGKVIYLDAGHGGKDPGAYYKDIYEEDINLSITLKLRDKLEKLGAVIYLTREEDYDLANPNASLRKKSDLGNRAKMINSSDADIYLSIHLNSSTNTSWKGAQVFYDDINKNNEAIAKLFQEEFNKKLKSNRDAKEISALYMYKNITKPGVLLEVGFISNPGDRYLLKKDDYQDKISNVIANTLIKYFNGQIQYIIFLHLGVATCK